MSVEEKPMKKVLVTGFAPFGAETVNPSYEAVKLLRRFFPQRFPPRRLRRNATRLS